MGHGLHVPFSWFPVNKVIKCKKLNPLKSNNICQLSVKKIGPLLAFSLLGS